MAITIENLDQQPPCKYCGQHLRDHMRDVEGVLYYTPCVEWLRTLGCEEWRAQLVDGICQACGHPVADHVSVWNPQASIQMGKSTTTVHAAGQIVWRVPRQFTGCPEPAES